MTRKEAEKIAESVAWWLNEALSAFKEGDIEDFEHCLEVAHERATRGVGE